MNFAIILSYLLIACVAVAGPSEPLPPAPGNDTPLKAGPLITVEHMTCQQAIKYVHRWHMFWEETEMDGPLPILYLDPIDSPAPICGYRHALDTWSHKTLDSSLCRLAYVCRPSF
jgi:hypothetical protein